MNERWFINASPLILLGKAAQLYWLPRLGHVSVPQSVAMEIAAGDALDPARVWLEGEGKGLIVADAMVPDEVLAWDLGEGETAVIAGTMACAGAECVLDDGAARRCAAAQGITVRGTLSLVLVAKRRAFIPACRPVFDEIVTAGLFITPALVARVLEAAGEAD